MAATVSSRFLAGADDQIQRPARGTTRTTASTDSHGPTNGSQNPSAGLVSANADSTVEGGRRPSRGECSWLPADTVISHTPSL